MAHEIIVVACFAAIAAYNIYLCDFFGPLKRVPGPFWARVTRLWEYRNSASKEHLYAHTMQKLHEKHGPVVRIAPGKYSIADPEAIKIIYSYSSKFTKSAWYDYFGTIFEGRDLFSSRDNQQHSAHRRQVGNLYSLSSMKAYEPRVDDIHERLHRRFEEFANNGAIINIPDWMQFYAFDVIGQITFSHSFGLLERGSDSGVLKNIHDSTVLATSIGSGGPHWAYPLYNFKKLLGIKSKETYLSDWVYQRANEHSKLAPTDDPDALGDFNQKMLSMISEGKLLEERRFMTFGSNIGAGSDTTGTILGAIAWYLLQNPNVTAKLRQEIAERVSEGRLSDPVTFAESQDMPYVQAVIKESLRMHPAVGGDLPRVVPKGGLQASGYYFPEGTSVGANAWIVNYNKDIFGQDADVFRPERWLEDTERAKKWETLWLTFGAGSRVCIGKNIALLEMSKMVPQLYRYFDFELTSKGRQLYPGFIVKHGFEARVKLLEKPL